MKTFLVCFCIGILIVVGWFKSLFGLIGCDFQAPYKAEAIYAVGTFVLPLGAFIGWMDIGK